MNSSNSPPDDEILQSATRLYDALCALSSASPEAMITELRRLRSAREDLEALAILAAPDPDVVQDAIVILGEKGGRGGKGLAAEVWSRVEKRISAPAPAASVPADSIDIPHPGLVPAGFRVLASGTYRVDPDGQLVRVCRLPLVLAGLARDLDGGSAYCRLRWHAREAWHDLDVPRVDALARSRLPGAVVDAGLVVSSESAGDVVGYIEAALASADQLPEAATSRVMGWRPGGFLLGSSWLPSEPGGADVRLADSDPGLRQLAEGYRSAGTWEGWCDLIGLASTFPRVSIAILASLAGPLLGKLGAEVPNAILDFAGETSQGKTTTLRIAASVWGHPSERAGLLLTWDMTRTSLERVAAACSDLPLFVDDTKRGKADQIGPMVYQVANGKGRGRGTVTGLQASSEWRTVLLSTGEQPLTSYTQDAGAAARCLTLWGTPLPDASAETVQRLAIAALEHHGHAGPRLIRWLHQTPPEMLRRWYREALAVGQSELGASPVAARACSFLALLHTAWRASLAIGVPDVGDAWRNEVIASIVSAASRADNPRRALDALFAWCSSNAHLFYGRDAFDEAPSGRVVGRWADGDGWAEICVYPEIVRQEIARLGFDADACIRSWSDRGWLVRDGQHLGPKVLIPGAGRLRMLCFPRAALETER